MKNLLRFFILALLITSCQKEENLDPPTDDQTLQIDLKGVVQKGPFRTGSVVQIYELDRSLNQTGKTFSTTVYENLNGSFYIDNLKLESKYIELKVEGYFFDEIKGIASGQKIVLKSICDATQSDICNVNILTHISYERIKYLVQERNMSFEDAKKQTEEDIFNIFYFNTNSELQFETLDLSKSGELNNKLLAISSIFLSANNNSTSYTVYEELLAEFCFDIKTDGTLDSDEIKQKLATSAVYLNTYAVRTHLSEHYGLDTNYNHLPQYVQYYIDNIDYKPYIEIDFSDSPIYGKNLLGLTDLTQLNIGEKYYLGIDGFLYVPEGYQLMVFIGMISETGDMNLVSLIDDDAFYQYHPIPWNGMSSHHSFIVGENYGYGYKGGFYINPSGKGSLKMIIEVQSQPVMDYSFTFTKEFRW